VESKESIAPGDLVGASLPGGPRIGVILSQRSNRVELRLGDDNRSTALPRRDLFCLSSLAADWPPERLPQAWNQPPWKLSEAALAVALPSSRELGAAWLLLREASSEGPINLGGLVDLIGDRSDPAQLAACWRWLEGDQTLFRWRQGHLEARPLSELRPLRHQRRRHALELQARQRWSDTLRRRKPLDASLLDREQQQDLRLLRCWASGDTTTALPEPLSRLLHDCRCQADPGAIRHLLADLGQWERHHLPALEATTWEQGFNADLLAEADRLCQQADGDWPGDGDRQDRTAQRVVTIDDEDTREIDDGLALERLEGDHCRLWIHIADPGRLVAAGSPLDLEAARRASSLYLARGTLPMFPPALAHGPMSLRAAKRCAAWSLWVDLDGDGQVLADGLERTWIRPAYRLSYADADALLELAPPQERDLLTIAELLGRRERWRQRRGALRLDDPEGRFRARRSEPGSSGVDPAPADDGSGPSAAASGDGGSDPTALRAELEVTEPSPARRMVAEAMVLAGAVVAERGRRLGVVLPYRSQPVCALPSNTELEALPPGPVRHAAIKRCLSRGQVGTTAAPHFSLGLDAYVQATSPIRRYADLVVQRQLQCLLEGTPPLGEAELAEQLQDLEPALRQGVQIQRDDQRHWLQVWFEQQPRHSLDGLFLRWLRADQQLGLVWIEELCQSLPCTCPARCEPGHRLLVRAVEVDALRDRLRLEATT
jgi:exoribonuclease-2